MNFFLDKFFQTPIQFLRSVGPSRGETLQKELQVFTYGDLILHFPFRYIDKSKFHTIREALNSENYVQIKGRIVKVEKLGKPRQQRLVARLEDDTGSVDLVWFQGVQWLEKKIQKGYEYIIFGKPNMFGNNINFSHPDIELAVEAATQNHKMLFEPVYFSTEKMKSKGLDSKGLMKIQKILHEELKLQDIAETLTQDLVLKYQFQSKKQSLLDIHFPSNLQNIEKAQHRLCFEELFYSQLQILFRRTQRINVEKGFVFKELHLFNHFYNHHLPFTLTQAQKKVIKEIRQDVLSGKVMNRLLQGDVGSGKTIVAFLSMLMAIDNGFQVCMLAPTEILAQQHFETLKDFADELKLPIALLTGSVKEKDKKNIRTALSQNVLKILVGTHAIIEDKVEFHNLGLAIIDEQHRFGVAQRAKLQEKNQSPPHILVMSATPIPRTLAMTVYGDLEVSVINELPEGRKPIITVHRYDKQRLSVFQFLRDEISKGRQVYIVYPLIEESETMDYKDLMDGFESISRAFPKPDYQVSIVHGKMKSEDKDYEMKRFLKKETQIMVATTVIEVGVNVPNASVMVIESAERFGLAQLHQLRGRVGRGSEQSYCILMTGEKLSNDGRKRIKTMCDTNDGFIISEVDLELRGPGDIQGTQQSGVIDFKIANLLRDQQLLQQARNQVVAIYESDADLSAPKHYIYKTMLQFIKKNATDWSVIA